MIQGPTENKTVYFYVGNVGLDTAVPKWVQSSSTIVVKFSEVEPWKKRPSTVDAAMCFRSAVHCCSALSSMSRVLFSLNCVRSAEESWNYFAWEPQTTTNVKNAPDCVWVADRHKKAPKLKLNDCRLLQPQTNILNEDDNMDSRLHWPIRLSSLLSLLFLCVICSTSVHADTNITLDDGDSRIIYSPASAWINSKSRLDSWWIIHGDADAKRNCIVQLHGRVFVFIYPNTIIWRRCYQALPYIFFPLSLPTMSLRQSL